LGHRLAAEAAPEIALDLLLARAGAVQAGEPRRAPALRGAGTEVEAAARDAGRIDQGPQALALALVDRTGGVHLRDLDDRPRRRDGRTDLGGVPLGARRL